MKKAIGVGIAGGAALSIHLRWVRPRIFSWGATPEELDRPMPGDEVCPQPQLNATRAVTIAARPEQVWPWLVQWGWNRAGFYSYDVLDNLGRPSTEEILPQFQQLAAGDWVPMSSKTTPYTAFRVTRLEPGRLMLWEKNGGTWLWLLEPADPEHTRLITRMRSRYQWTRPTVVTELILMEIGDPFMMRKCLLGIKQRAERLRNRPAPPTAGTAAEHAPEARKQPAKGRQHEMRPVVVEAEVDINRSPEDVLDYCSDHRHEPEWNPMMKRIKKLTGGPIGTGTRYAAEFVKGPPMVMEVHPVPAPGQLVPDR